MEFDKERLKELSEKYLFDLRYDYTGEFLKNSEKSFWHYIRKEEVPELILELLKD